MSEINNSSSDDLLSLRESILSVAIESATQEEKRAEILLKKSDFLMKYISATFVIINALQIAYSFFLFSDKIINNVTCTSTKNENRIIYKKLFFFAENVHEHEQSAPGKPSPEH